MHLYYFPNHRTPFANTFYFCSTSIAPAGVREKRARPVWPLEGNLRTFVAEKLRLKFSWFKPRKARCVRNLMGFVIFVIVVISFCKMCEHVCKWTNKNIESVWIFNNVFTFMNVVVVVASDGIMCRDKHCSVQKPRIMVVKCCCQCLESCQSSLLLIFYFVFIENWNNGFTFSHGKCCITYWRRLESFNTKLVTTQKCKVSGENFPSLVFQLLN